MAIRTETKDDKPAYFPKLMEGDSGIVVLFTCDSWGTVIKKNTIHGTGYYSTTWEMSRFKDFSGRITLINE